ncbi:MAG: hypothetical protein IJT07_00730, partial [Oscillospiraceae bacterium]|nr:hypothetical protein [Oscillospiraceae bacterium]
SSDPKGEGTGDQWSPLRDGDFGAFVGAHSMRPSETVQGRDKRAIDNRPYDERDEVRLCDTVEMKKGD